MKNLVFIVLVLSVLSGCSTRVDHQRIKQVKSVAVVGYSIARDPGNPLQFIINQTEADDYVEHLATDFYRSFTQTFAQKLNVRTITLDQIVSNPYYQKLYQKYSNVEESTMVMGQTYRAEGMLSGQAVFKLTPTEKTQLANALGVDSVIGLESMIYQGESMGISIVKLSANEVKFRVTITDYEQYDRLNAEPIVEISNYIGDTPDDSYMSYGILVKDETWDLTKPDRKALVAAVSTVAEGLAEKIETAK